MILNKTATYAIRAMAYLGQDTRDGPRRVKQIADEMDVPVNFLSKIINRLVHEGLLVSVRGRAGGVSLAKPAKSISMAQVVAPFMRLDPGAECLFAPGICNARCKLHDRWYPIVDSARTLLDKTMIDDLL